MPGGEQSPAHEVVDTALVLLEVRGSARGGRQDRVVVGHLRVVDKARPEGARPRPARELRAVRLGDRAHDVRERLGDGSGQSPAVGPGIAEELPSLVERLGHVEGPLRAHSVEAVRVPLELGQVIEKRRRQRPDLSLDRLDARFAAPDALRDTRRLLPVLRQPPQVASEPGPGVGARRRGLTIEGDRVGRGSDRRVALRGQGLKGRHDLEVVLGDERPYLELAGHHHGQGRRLHAPDREHVGVHEAVRAREVHAHEPVRSAPRASGAGERVELASVAELSKALGDRVRRERRESRGAGRASDSVRPRRCNGRSAHLRVPRPSRRRPP